MPKPRPPELALVSGVPEWAWVLGLGSPACREGMQLAQGSQHAKGC